jgi:hypothetical protein
VTPPSHLRASRREWIVALLVVLATGVASTWPLATSPWLIPDHQDPLFSSWRLYTWARNLASPAPTAGSRAIQFHPADTVLLYSDAILLPALIGAPFVLAGVHVVLVYTGLVWLSILSAGLAMCALRALPVGQSRRVAGRRHPLRGRPAASRSRDAPRAVVQRVRRWRCWRRRVRSTAAFAAPGASARAWPPSS